MRGARSAADRSRREPASKQAVEILWLSSCRRVSARSGGQTRPFPAGLRHSAAFLTDVSNWEYYVPSERDSHKYRAALAPHRRDVDGDRIVRGDTGSLRNVGPGYAPQLDRAVRDRCSFLAALGPGNAARPSPRRKARAQTGYLHDARRHRSRDECGLFSLERCAGHFAESAGAISTADRHHVYLVGTI